MFFKKWELKTQLSEQIKKGISLTDLLLHYELYKTVRMLTKPFEYYFFPPEEMEKAEPNLPHLDELIKFSLSHEYKEF